jgi:hypothetical protein
VHRTYADATHEVTDPDGTITKYDTSGQPVPGADGYQPRPPQHAHPSTVHKQHAYNAPKPMEHRKPKTKPSPHHPPDGKHPTHQKHPNRY